MSKYYTPQPPSTAASSYMANIISDSILAGGRSQNQIYTRSITSNAHNTNQTSVYHKEYSQGDRAAHGRAFLDSFNELSKKINSCNNDATKASLVKQRNSLCKDVIGYWERVIKYFESIPEQAGSQEHIEGYKNVIIGDLEKIVDESDLVLEKYKDFKPENDLSNLMILEIKSGYENLEEKINNNLAEKNIGDEIKLQVWQSNHYRSKYNQLLHKLKTHEQVVKEYQGKILKCDILYEANAFDMDLKKKHKETMDELNFNSNQLIKCLVTTALQMSGQPLEENPMMSDIKSILDGFKEKINKNLTDNEINEETKLKAWKTFSSEYDQHLNKLKSLEESVKGCQRDLLICTYAQACSLNNNLISYQNDMNNWKINSNRFVEKFTNKAIEFLHKSAPYKIGQKYKHYKPENDSENPMILEINSTIAELDAKINKNLSDNGIEREIADKAFELFSFEYDQLSYKFEMHKKQVKIYQNQIIKCASLIQADSTNNKLERYYQKLMDELKFESNQLNKKLVNKAIELSQQPSEQNLIEDDQYIANVVPNQQNNFSIEELLEKIAKLEQTVVEKDGIITEKDQKLELVNSTNQNLIEDKSVLNKEVKKLAIENSGLKNKYEVSQSENQALKIQVHGLKEDKTELRTEIKEVKKKLDKKEDKINDLIDKTDELNEKLLEETNKYYDIKIKYDILFSNHLINDEGFVLVSGDDHQAVNNL